MAVEFTGVFTDQLVTFPELFGERGGGRLLIRVFVCASIVLIARGREQWGEEGFLVPGLPGRASRRWP